MRIGCITGTQSSHNCACCGTSQYSVGMLRSIQKWKDLGHPAVKAPFKACISWIISSDFVQTFLTRTYFCKAWKCISIYTGELSATHVHSSPQLYFPEFLWWAWTSVSDLGWCPHLSCPIAIVISGLYFDTWQNSSFTCNFPQWSFLR